MQESLFSQGIDLMIFGMGTVCVFLAVLVVVTIGMSKFVVRFFPDPPEDLMHSKRLKSAPVSATVDGKTLAIIHAAIQQHRHN